MEELSRLQKLAREVGTGSVTPDYVKQAELQVELTQEVGAKLYHLARVIEKSSRQASDDLLALRGALADVVKSMDASTRTMARLTGWLIAATSVSAFAAVALVVLAWLRKG